MVYLAASSKCYGQVTSTHTRHKYRIPRYNQYILNIMMCI